MKKNTEAMLGIVLPDKDVVTLVTKLRLGNNLDYLT